MSNESKLNSRLYADTGAGEQLLVPEALTRQLLAFRDRVWTSKILEAVAFGLVAFLLSFLTVYVLDRVWDTPATARLSLFLLALAMWIAVPYALHRWVWKNRSLEQLARLLRVRESSIGDQLLSVIELSHNESEQARSRTLCAAAIGQVAATAEGRDFKHAAPPTKLTLLTWLLAAAGVFCLSLAVLFPSAAANAWSRFTTPWQNTPRYTFTAVQPLNSRLVVPHGEATSLVVALDPDSRWVPPMATARLGQHIDLQAPLEDAKYAFELPPQVEPASLTVQVGDYYQTVIVEPKLRPELVEAVAQITLPEYLARSGDYERDVRSGAVSVVQGGSAIVRATASRSLAKAAVDGNARQPAEDSFDSGEISVGDRPLTFEFTWEDHDGLSGRAPFLLDVEPLADEPPTVLSQDLPHQAVILDTEQLNFQALAADDFGIKRIGLEWRGLDEAGLAVPAAGEKLIAAGGPEMTSMQVPAVFSAGVLGISPQPLEVRLWVEDYLPDRERIYSPTHLFFVLTAEQHAIWIANQLSSWHRASLDVRDQEMQLHATNKRLREMPPGMLSGEEMQAELGRQAALETANARRLSSLTKTGEQLLQQAARNPQIGVERLERWAEMLQVLNEIADDRMPSVSDLLTQASRQQAKAASGQPSDGSPNSQPPRAGQVRATPNGSRDAAEESSEEDESADEQAALPKIADVESSMQPDDEGAADSGQSQKQKGGAAGLSLAGTTLIGPPGESDPPQEEADAEEEPLEEALFEQQELLAEFEKVADELNAVLANLEGSTLVKRLKAAARQQSQVARKIASRINAYFGTAQRLRAEDRQLLQDLRDVEDQSSQELSYIMDDMQSYYERRRMNQFKLVLDEMQEWDVLQALQMLGEDLPVERGLSIAQAEFWADTLDRWAEDLVEPADGEKQSESKAKSADALPPRLILEALKILEGEVNLREATRVAEQARPALQPEQHQQESIALSETQDSLRSRTEDVIQAIEDLPEGNARFGNELELLGAVSHVMREAGLMLAAAETGSPTIAAETEAIELLLQSNRINPKSAGGGGGSSPGGGGKGETQDSALALLGSGLNQNEQREPRDITQATGESGRQLPEEYRAGLDEYFNRWEEVLN